LVSISEDTSVRNEPMVRNQIFGCRRLVGGVDCDDIFICYLDKWIN